MAQREQDLGTRIDNLEIKVTYQDDVIETLNRTIVRQWHAIEQLQKRADLLEQRLREAQEAPGRDPRDDPPPPHW